MFLLRSWWLRVTFAHVSKKVNTVTVRLSDEELDLLDERATERGIAVSTYMRMTALFAAKSGVGLSQLSQEVLDAIVSKIHDGRVLEEPPERL